jgi:hypothetical protein
MKNEWIAAVKKAYKQDGKVFAGDLQTKYPHSYGQGIWIFGDWDTALLAAGLTSAKNIRPLTWLGGAV